MANKRAGSRNGAGMTEKDAVRQALQALGRDAKPAEIQPYIKKTFGIEMTPEHITTAKGEILRKEREGAAPRPSAGGRAATQATRPEATPEPANGMSKKEAVQRAIEALGRDATPSELQPYIKGTFGIEMTLGHVKTARSEFLRGGKKGKKRPGPKPKGEQPAATPQPERAAPTPVAKAQPGQRAGITLDDIQAVQGLVGRVGVDTLKGLIDVLSR